MNFHCNTMIFTKYIIVWLSYQTCFTLPEILQQVFLLLNIHYFGTKGARKLEGLRRGVCVFWFGFGGGYQFY